MSARIAVRPIGYRHPDVPWNGLTATDLFCGAGGSSSGLVEAGYRVVIAANDVGTSREAAVAPSGCVATASRSFSRPITTTTPAHGAACSASAATRRSACSRTTRSCSAVLRTTSRTRRGSSSWSNSQRTRGGAR